MPDNLHQRTQGSDNQCGQRPTSFKLRRAAFKGRGLRADLRGQPFARLRDLAYEGRGA